MPSKSFLCSCITPDYAELGCTKGEGFSELISNAETITRAEFLQYCEIEPELAKNMFRFRNDYSFHKNGEIYFFTHSLIEYFYK
jgi:hypothetical protein